MSEVHRYVGRGGSAVTVAVNDIDFAAFAVVVLVDELTRAAVRERPECISDDRLVDGLCEIVVGYLTHREGSGAPPIREG